MAAAQRLARHSSPRISLGVYTHSFSNADGSNAHRMGQVIALSRGATG